MILKPVMAFCVTQVNINILFAFCKGRNINIHTWAWFDYFICYEGKSGSIYNLVKN